MKTIIAYVERAEYALMVLGLFVAVAILFLQVILRYVFSASLPWIEEAARYLFIYFTWIGTSIAASSDQHIRFEVLDNRFPKAERYLGILRNLVCAGVSVFMLVYGGRLIYIMLQNVAVSPSMKIPMWVCYCIVPVGGTLMTLKYCYKIFQDIAAS